MVSLVWSSAGGSHRSLDHPVAIRQAWARKRDIDLGRSAERGTELIAGSVLSVLSYCTVQPGCNCTRYCTWYSTTAYCALCFTVRYRAVKEIYRQYRYVINQYSSMAPFAILKFHECTLHVQPNSPSPPSESSESSNRPLTFDCAINFCADTAISTPPPAPLFLSSCP